MESVTVLAGRHPKGSPAQQTASTLLADVVDQLDCLNINQVSKINTYMLL